MKTLFRWSVGPAVLVLLVAGAGSASPRWSARVGLNLTEWLDLFQQLAVEYRREAILTDHASRTIYSLEAKSCVVRDLCAGRLTLMEAAARFRDLSGPGDDVYLKWSRRHEPGKTDEERWCRRVILFLPGPDAGRPSPADRFEAELAQQLAQGPLHLPD
jgi:hypothetical protein